MTVQGSFFSEEKLYDPLPEPCQSCGHSVGVVAWRDKRITGLRCQKCGFVLDPSLVLLHPLQKDCSCGASSASAVGFVIPKANNNALHCIACGVWNWNVSDADLGVAPKQYHRPRIAEWLRMELMQEAQCQCLVCGSDEEQRDVGHCISVDEGHRLDLSDDLLFNRWNLAIMCKRCNKGFGSRSVWPRLYVDRLKPTEYDKPVPDPTFTKILQLLRKINASRRDAA